MIKLNDVVQIAETIRDGYGDASAIILGEIEACFLQGSGSIHSNNADIAESDAHVYLDIYNEVLIEKGYKIEGLYIIASPFNEGDDDNWYRITRVKVGQRKLLNNEVDNVHAYLKKVAKLKTNYVS